MVDADFDMPTAGKKRFDTLHVILMILLAIIVTVFLSVWIFRTWIFPTHFTPVTLSEKQEQQLGRKLSRLGLSGLNPDITVPSSAVIVGEKLEPEVFSEKDARHEVSLTEDEINALLAKNTDLADKLAIDLSDDLISAKLLVPLDEDFPILGGKTLKMKAGIELAFVDSRPRVVLKGVTIMGVAVPNAWLGNLKNIDLVDEYGQNEGFWKSFAEGVEALDVEDGRIQIKLKE
ncbi:MAG: arginine N-succinyltransferase [Gammaproteobacteria bacterium]